MNVFVISVWVQFSLQLCPYKDVFLTEIVSNSIVFQPTKMKDFTAYFYAHLLLTVMIACLQPFAPLNDSLP